MDDVKRESSAGTVQPRPAPGDDAEDFSQRATYTYLIGVYLAVNAVQDLYLLVEGPDCTYMKTQYVQGNHDWLSTLTSVSGFHRVANTALHPSMMTESREEAVREMMLRIASTDEPAALILTSMPMAFVTGADYERLCQDVAAETGRPVLHVQGLSLSRDWLDGYAETLGSLARQIDLPVEEKGARKVAIVGYLFDRNEDDHTANIRELEAMLEALDLELVSVWLSGQRVDELKRVAEAGTILSLPYGRKAARQIARRTGARLLELELPFGLTAVESWMSDLGEEFAAGEKAAAYVTRQMQRIAPRLEWLIPFVFQELTASYVGDPHLLPGFDDILTLLGARLEAAVVTNRKAHCREILAMADRVELLVWPRHAAFIRFVLDKAAYGKADLLLSNNYGMSISVGKTAVVEFGFPSVFTHALFDRPFLGFGGFMAFVDTLANTIRQRELADARPRLEDLVVEP